MSEPAKKAIFLSYAREDTDAARRIADALRSSGVEVWFDQNELRGGDAWDQKIRGQIKDCTLFLPIVSAHTQDRGEGYFRLEWKLASERTHLMAEGVPFISPIVVDETSEAGAVVPPEFMRVQWTRLRGALPTSQFVEQVQRLLASPRRSAASAEAAPTAAAPLSSAKAAPSPMRFAVAALGIVVLALVAYIALRSPAKESPASVAAPKPIAESKPSAPPPSTAPKVTDKSIAVLPFTKMSDEKDASAFFADGVHEDILTNLALARDLKVVSRTTVTQYRDSKKTLRQIGEELGVAYILEGSVRRVGNKVRVTGQLINARTDEHVWAKSYDRDLTDIFAIQASLSQEIASALAATLTPQAQKFIERRPTENPVAYDAYLKGRDSRNRSRTGQLAPTRQQEAFFQSAVDQDPNFAAAWGELAVVHALNVFWEFDHTPARLAQADAAIGRAVRLAPDAPDVIRSLGTYAYYAYRDYARATEQYEKLAKLQPNDPTVFNSLSLIQRRQGRWADSLSNVRRALELDPANISYTRNLLSTLTMLRRWDDAIATQRRLVTLLPQELVEQAEVQRLTYLATGSRKESDAWFASLSPAQLNSPKMISMRKGYAAALGDFSEFKRLDQLQPFYDGDGTPHSRQAADAAGNYFIYGDAAAALARLGNFPAEVRAQLEREPTNVKLWSDLSWMEVILGHKDEALRCARKASELLPESLDAFDGPRYSIYLADTLVWAGDKDRAVAEYARLLRVAGTGGTLNTSYMKSNAFYAPLRGDPRWEALINDAKNNALQTER